jgi:hypothetical protein
MLTKIMRWYFIPVLLLALLWPSSAGYLILLGFSVWGAIWAVQASRAGRYLWQAGYTMVSPKVKYEN